MALAPPVGAVEGRGARSEKMERARSAQDADYIAPHLSETRRRQALKRPFGLVGGLQLSESVALYLREQIISGKLKAGQFLRIDALAKELSVSSTPVREGLLMLQSESFVRLMPRRGFVVNSFSKSDLRDLFWAQATVGAELAARAVAKLPQAEIARLEQLHAQYVTAVKAGDQKLAANLGHEFHRTINLAAQSPRLALLMGGLAKQLTNLFYASIEGSLADALKYHTLILKALRAKKVESCRTLMYRHIVTAGEDLIAQLEREGLFAKSFQEQRATLARGRTRGVRGLRRDRKGSAEG